MRHLLLALMGLFLLSVDASAEESTLSSQVETTLRSRRCHHRRHHSSSSSTNVVVGPTGPMGLPGVPGATGSLASSYASVFNNDENGQTIIAVVFTNVVFKGQELPPVNISTNSTGDLTTFDTLQVHKSGVYLIGWKLTMTGPADSTEDGFVGLVINGNTEPLKSTLEFGKISTGTIFAGQTILHLKAGDTIQLVASGEFAKVNLPSLIVTQIAE